MNKAIEYLCWGWNETYRTLAHTPVSTFSPHTYSYVDIHRHIHNHSFTNATIITDQINEEFKIDKQQFEDQDVKLSYAVAVSPNEVRVTIPKDYENEVIQFISRVETIQLGLIKSEAKVVVNEKTSSITVSGEILLNSCAIQYQGTNILIAKDENLQAVLQKLTDYFTTKDQISIIKDLHTAGHLRAKFEVQ